MSELQPFDEWPDDRFERIYQSENALGRALLANLEGRMQFIKKKCAALVPELAESDIEAIAKEAALEGIYALLMVLDGVAATGIDAEHGIEWTLQAQILSYGSQSKSIEVAMESGGGMTLSSFRPSGTESVETVEVLPAGDGLCYAFHEWKETTKG